MKFYNTFSIRDYILKNINQVDIFAYYFELPQYDIYKSLTVNSFMLLNRLRQDDTPSLSFRRDGDKVYVKDFGNDYFSGDCFHIAGTKLGLNSNYPAHFKLICDNIINNVKAEIVIGKREIPVSRRSEDNVIIEPYIREFTLRDYNFWTNFHLKKDNIDRNVQCVESFEMIVADELVATYNYKKEDPCYLYQLGTMKGVPRYKLYFPKRSKVRFITNNIFAIDDITRIRKNEKCILIKARKDRFLMDQIIRELYLTNISVIAVSYEGARFTQQELNLLHSMYKEIFVLYDNDKAGLDNMIFCKKEYSFQPLYIISAIKELNPELIPDHIKTDTVLLHKDIPKDICEFAWKHDYNQTVNIVKHLINQTL